MPTAPFNLLLNFIEKDMRMGHVYQPVMLIELLRSSGKVTVEQIAKALLLEDRAQLANNALAIITRIFFMVTSSFFYQPTIQSRLDLESDNKIYINQQVKYYRAK